MKGEHIPLSERLRPIGLDDFVGQEHLLSEGRVLQQMIISGKAHSIIFWGPPGVGKTTLAQIIARSLKVPFFSLSAIDSGVKDVRNVIELAKRSGQALLFIDEIHRFNKAQQDCLLGAVEKGTIVLIGATTENPSFEVISALLSRCQVYILKHLSEGNLMQLVELAVKKDKWLQQKELLIEEWEALFLFCSGDARKLLNLIELIADTVSPESKVVTNKLVQDIVQKKMALYDKTGEQHYDIISAFIKSLRGSDPNAAVYWLARMIEGGEDPTFIARRMIVLASEDIGNANPNALLLAISCFQAVQLIGMPESRIILSQTAVYLACSAKSNASYIAIETALALVRETGDLAVPLHIRNAPTGLMKKLDYGLGYQYAHDFTGNFVEQEYLPEGIEGKKIYEPAKNASELKMKDYLRSCWKEKYDY